MATLKHEDFPRFVTPSCAAVAFGFEGVVVFPCALAMLSSARRVQIRSFSPSVARVVWAPRFSSVRSAHHEPTLGSLLQSGAAFDDAVGWVQRSECGAVPIRAEDEVMYFWSSTPPPWLVPEISGAEFLSFLPDAMRPGKVTQRRVPTDVTPIPELDASEVVDQPQEWSEGASRSRVRCCDMMREAGFGSVLGASMCCLLDR
jgi:hypothetical protein